MRRVMLNRLSFAEGCCSWSFTHVKFTDMWIFLLWEATRGSRGAVTSISIHLYFFLNSNCELKVNEYGALGRVLLENSGSFITRLHTHLTGKGKEMELLKVYSKTDLNKCSTTVTRSRLNSRSTDGRVPEKKNKPTVMPYVTGSHINKSVPQYVLLSLFPPLSQALKVRMGEVIKKKQVICTISKSQHLLLDHQKFRIALVVNLKRESLYFEVLES